MDQDLTLNYIRSLLCEGNGHLFRHELTEKRYLTKSLIPNAHYKEGQMIWFTFDDKRIKWSDDFTLSLIEDQDGNKIYQFLNSFAVEGTLGYEYLDVEYSLICGLKFYCLAYYYPGSALIAPDHIKLLTHEQKIEWEYEQMLSTKAEKIGIRNLVNQITFEDLSVLWKKVNPLDKEQIELTSYYFWNDLQLTLNLLINLVAEINFYGEYLGNYGIQAVRREPKIYLHHYEKSFLRKSSFCIQVFYSYWEKIAYLLFIFLKIENVSKTNLSLVKLKKALSKAMNNGQYQYFNDASSAYNWFVDFIENDHSALAKYRHPLVHFQPDNELFKGDFYAGALNFYLMNITNHEKRMSLEKEFNEIQSFLTNQLHKCNEGLRKAIDLIQEIRD
jgi:hypothetical protein